VLRGANGADDTDEADFSGFFLDSDSSNVSCRIKWTWILVLGEKYPLDSNWISLWDISWHPNHFTFYTIHSDNRPNPKRIRGNPLFPRNPRRSPRAALELFQCGDGVLPDSLPQQTVQ
jgi:hypothetical protein